MDAIAKPKGCTNFMLRRLMRQVARFYDVEVTKSGLKTTQYTLLSSVLKLGPVRPSDLAKSLNLEASTLTRNLKPLVAAGWLTQAEGPDGRSRHIVITEAGRAKRAEAKSHWLAAQEKLNLLLGDDKVIALHALIDESVALMRAGGHTDTEEGELHV